MLFVFTPMQPSLMCCSFYVWCRWLKKSTTFCLRRRDPMHLWGQEWCFTELSHHPHHPREVIDSWGMTLVLESCDFLALKALSCLTTGGISLSEFSLRWNMANFLFHNSSSPALHKTPCALVLPELLKGLNMCKSPFFWVFYLNHQLAT